MNYKFEWGDAQLEYLNLLAMSISPKVPPPPVSTAYVCIPLHESKIPNFPSIYCTLKSGHSTFIFSFVSPVTQH